MHNLHLNAIVANCKYIYAECYVHALCVPFIDCASNALYVWMMRVTDYYIFILITFTYKSYVYVCHCTVSICIELQWTELNNAICLTYFMYLNVNDNMYNVTMSWFRNGIITWIVAQSSLLCHSLHHTSPPPPTHAHSSST